MTKSPHPARSQRVRIVRPKLDAYWPALFRKAWDAHYGQAKDIRTAAARQIKAIENEPSTLLDRIMNATNTHVIAAYAAKLTGLERKKALMAEKRDAQSVPSGTIEEQLEPPLQFLSNPLKGWESVSFLHAERF
ncbi:MAG: hypothetical protein QNJ09_02215 [Paracoccaceae bacterium]|nr:hypothetical protein [Paracoccaceae bacterium]